MTRSPLPGQAQEAADFIGSRFSLRPRVGIVLGTGAGVVAAEIKADSIFDYSEIPNFPVSTAIGHRGRLVCGTLADQPVLAMDGRFHLYEGHPPDLVTLPIQVMRTMGVEVLFVTNASGGINPKFKSGDIMAIHSHIDLMCRTSVASSVEVETERPIDRTDAYDAELITIAQRCARKNNFVLHEGVYAALLGPNYETRAEYRMLMRIGADVAGMSTVPEVNVAAKLGLRILALSVITNVAKPDVQLPTSGQEVIDAGELAAPRIQKIVLDAICRLSRS